MNDDNRVFVARRPLKALANIKSGAMGDGLIY